MVALVAIEINLGTVILCIAYNRLYILDYVHMIRLYDIV